MHTIGIIPARMGSGRFPGKPLADILGVPMLGHCWFRARQCATLDAVYIATCDEEIRAYTDSIAAPCIMTLASHERASDRCAEAMLAIEKQTGRKVDVVVMIQGDEPMLTPDMIDAALRPLAGEPAVQVVNLMAELKTVAEQQDVNEVKVVTDCRGDALYFSRESIPSSRKGVTPKVYKQVCIIPFRRDFLLKFNTWPQTPCEIAESVDMLRVLEHGEKVRMVLSEHETYSVDTPADLAVVAAAMHDDVLRFVYTGRRL